MFFATSVGIFLFCVVSCLGHCMHSVRKTFGRAWVNSTFHKSIVVVAIICVMFGPMVHVALMQCTHDFWVSVGNFHESIAAVAVVYVVFDLSQS